MKRDMDLVRQILIFIEDHEHGFAPPQIEIDGYTDEVISFHLLLMGEADLLKVIDVSAQQDLSPRCIVERMTCAGYEFLANTRNETIWNKVKGIVVSKGGSVSFEVLKFLVVETAKTYFVGGAGPASLPPRHP